MTITVVHEPWRPHPLAWIHRAEARSIVEELRRAGREVHAVAFSKETVSNLPSGPLLLRLSDPVMFAAAKTLARESIPYAGPGAAAMERCYDKYEAWRIATAHGVDSPVTALADGPRPAAGPLVLKPRRGSDSLGLRLLADGTIPPRCRNADHIVQEQVRGAELTVAVFRGIAGMPFRILLPEGAPYSFLRKYLLRPGREAVADPALSGRIRSTALGIADVLGADWAARVDFMHEAGSGRLRFLECDVAPLVGAGSAFAASFSAAGVERAEQLRMLLGDVPRL